MKIGFKELLARLAKNQVEKITIADVATAQVHELVIKILCGGEINYISQLQELSSGRLSAVVRKQSDLGAAYDIKTWDTKFVVVNTREMNKRNFNCDSCKQ